MKGWAAQWIMELQEGETTKFRPRGSSMEPLIKSGQLVTVEPKGSLMVGDVVLCMVGGVQYLHKILDVQERFGKVMFQIGNNKGGINGWTEEHKIYGKLVKVED
jgi:SOS-response transcriptional repressor LexA